MKRFGLYAAALTLALTGVPVLSSQAAVRTVIVGEIVLMAEMDFP